VEMELRPSESRLAEGAFRPNSCIVSALSKDTNVCIKGGRTRNFRA
jgi:hypothetical protein